MFSLKQPNFLLKRDVVGEPFYKAEFHGSTLLLTGLLYKKFKKTEF